jgi:acetylornithine deacetylase/succinyl-diaminopimelate desuccinylase-like protein
MPTSRDGVERALALAAAGRARSVEALPSIIFGPGTIAQAHKPDEHIPVQEYLDCIEHLVEIIATWCGASIASASDRRKETVS